MRRARTDRDALEAAHEFLPGAAVLTANAPAAAVAAADPAAEARARAAAGDAAHAARLAAAYDARLFREYALVDISRRVPAAAPSSSSSSSSSSSAAPPPKAFRGPLGLRWRTAAEVLSGKGQFVCAAIAPACDSSSLMTFEVPFAYAERGERKAALVKLRLCARCAQRAFDAPSAGEDEKEEEEDRGVERGPAAAAAPAPDEAAAEEEGEAPPAGSKRKRAGGS
jgi:hypothetical protein